MTRETVSNGSTVQGVTPAGGYTSGELIRIGEMVGVVTATTLVGETFVANVRGEHRVTKPTGIDAFAQGDRVYVTGADAVTATAAGNIFVGICSTAATAAATEVNVLINTGTGTAP